MPAFEYFVVFAEMRTGSNFLEANINAFPSLLCHGEAFNPHFIGYPNKTEILGIDQRARDEDPRTLITAIKSDPTALGGFRFFNDHDPRVLDQILDDPKCAKIILTRNPMDSYVSWKIAKATGQWKLTDVRRRKDSLVDFDAGEFAAHVTKLQGFQITLLNKLQKSGQTAFYIAYEDLQDVDVMNGLAKFLGISEQLDELDDSLKRQNPSSIADKVSNFAEIPAALADLDFFNLTRTPNFEPRRGAAVPSYIATLESSLIFLPVPSGPVDPVSEWLASLDGVRPEELCSKMNQRQLRFWKEARDTSRCFTVLRHPVTRAHRVFCERILSTGPGSFMKIRRTMRNRFKLPIPEDFPDANYDRQAHRDAFAAYLKLIKSVLNGQTPIRQDGHWASQFSVVTGFAEVMPPDLILREEDLETALPALGQKFGMGRVPAYQSKESPLPFDLAEIYDAEIEKLTRNAYQRDYDAFGFSDWIQGVSR